MSDAGAQRVMKTIRLVGGLALAAAVFVVDTFTPLSSAVAVIYVVSLLLLGEVLEPRWFKVAFAGALGLSVFSLFYSHGLTPELAAGLRFLVSIAAILITGFLVMRGARARLALEGQAQLLDLTQDAIFTRSEEGCIQFWNRGAERLYGWTRAEAVGRDPHALLGSRFPEPLADIERRLRVEGRWEGEIIHRRRDGSDLTVLSRWTLQPRQPGRPEAILETNTDITASKAAGAALRASEARYRTIFNTLAVGIWEHDFRPLKAAIAEVRASGVEDFARYLAETPDFVDRARRLLPITDVNETALALMGFENKADFYPFLSDFLPADDPSFAAFLIAVDEGQTYFQAEAEVRRRDGEIIPIIVAITFPPPEAEFDRVQAVILNIAERRRMQTAVDEAKAEAEKAMRGAAMGELSTTIAHEVNQPLAAIMTSSEAALRWMQRTPPDIDETRAALEDVLNATRHATGVVRRVRGLASRVRPEMEPTAFDALATDALRLIEQSIRGQGIALRATVSATGASVQADRVLVQQVITNLISNAAQALVGAGIEAPSIEVISGIHDGRGRIEVIDNGPGFSAENLARAFEPFFTTRTEGMGLGLAICRSIIEGHDGEISIESVEGQGARVTVSLPLAAA